VHLLEVNYVAQVNQIRTSYVDTSHNVVDSSERCKTD